ncbi:hypothetical protein FQN57_007088 [Myotisia sp. PD_48]|nr:hypothetical protein FQN57_007088 [Myotisia sp. PD_48]
MRFSTIASVALAAIPLALAQHQPVAVTFPTLEFNSPGFVITTEDFGKCVLAADRSPVLSMRIRPGVSCSLYGTDTCAEPARAANIIGDHPDLPLERLIGIIAVKCNPATKQAS